MRPIALRLTLGFLLIIVVVSAISAVVGVRFIGDRVVAEAQSKVETNLNAAREIYRSHLDDIHQVVRLTADRFYLKDALMAGDLQRAAVELGKTRAHEGLDILTLTDADGIVLVRTTNPNRVGDDQSDSGIVRAVLQRREPLEATLIVPAGDLVLESPFLAERARIRFAETPKARPREKDLETAGMVMQAGAPIFDYDGRLIGVLYGGILLNRNFEIVDKIKETVFRKVKYERKDIGTATIFQDDVRISTNVRREDGTRAIRTRVTEAVFDRVIARGEPWIGRAYVVDDWYITAYEPIRDVDDRIIGMLYVGVLEQPYVDLKRRTVLIFLGITSAGALLAMGLSYFVSSRLTVPIKKLVAASGEVAAGNLDAHVSIDSNGELAQLAEAFNTMASTLKRRDEKIKEFAKSKIMESERLAIIGQLAAGVAHELNNPLQGIVAYSHLLLERTEPEDPRHRSLEKIVNEAERCTTIIRGLLDFSRRREPHKKRTDVNALLEECLSLLENQAAFHNIEVEKRCDRALPEIVIDPSQIQQVFINMIINAVEAMEGNGRLTITSRHRPGDDVIAVEFADTGHGIRKEDMERIFDPFFTTKEDGHGTGLGLAISFGIVKRHKGSISVDSVAGEGTTFTVRLPVSVEVKRTAREGAEERASSTPGPTVGGRTDGATAANGASMASAAVEAV